MNTTLIITGSAPETVADIDAALSLLRLTPHASRLAPSFMSIGKSAMNKHLYPIKYMATYHPNEIDEAKRLRIEAGGNIDYKVISHEQKDGVDIIEPYEAPTGSSALCGALAAIRFGYKKIILCGCPLTDQKYVVFQAGWTAKKEKVKDYVRSMSGWTKDFLGEPTQEWLK